MGRRAIAGTRKDRPASARRRAGAGLAAIGLSVLAAAMWTGPGAHAQVAGLGVAITPGFQNPVTVGDQDRPARLQLVNSSFGLLAGLETVTVTNIRVNPGCATSAVNGAPTDPSPCPQAEPRANASQPILDIAGTSTAGTTCPGQPFTISGPDAEGDFAFTPTAGAVTLAGVGQAGSTCDIYFTFDVIQRPTDGATFQSAALTAASLSFPGGVPQTGVSGTTVNALQVTTTTTIVGTTTTVAGALPATTVPPGAQPGTTVPDTMAATGGPDVLVPGLALLALGFIGLALRHAVAHPPRTWFAG